MRANMMNEVVPFTNTRSSGLGTSISISTRVILRSNLIIYIWRIVALGLGAPFIW
jgi:hypothetical protein